MINENLDKNSSRMTAHEAVLLAHSRVDGALASSPLIIRSYTGHLMAAKGKFIRAVSLLTCAMQEDGLVTTDAVSLAAAIEILHLATLVHDDIIDDADTRRGKITLQKKFGRKTAVICGDYLLGVALKIASSIQNRQEYASLDLPDYISKICLGELYQHINSNNLDLSVYQYLKIIAGKTAALFEASFYAGAVLSGAVSADINQYMRLGRYIGMIFQLTDDCMDFEATENMAQKPTQSDYEQGVITLPLIYTFQQMAALKETAKTEKISRTALNAAVYKAGGLARTHRAAEKYYRKAMAIIDGLAISEEKRKGLTAIANKAYRKEQ